MYRAGKKKEERVPGMNHGNAKEKRMVQILEMLKKRQKISVTELAQSLDISTMTVRRDLEVLRKNHVLERSYGYATLARGGDEYAVGDEVYDLRMARIQNIHEKERIAHCAADMIQPGDWIFMDNGTTVSRMTSFLPTDFEFTVLCYNFAILTELLKHPNIETIFPGGYYYPEDQMFSSDESVEFIRRHRANKAFISTSGVHRSLGITCINAHSVSNKRAIIESSACNILLTDPSKFGEVKANHFAELSDIHMIITNSSITEEWNTFLKDAGVDLKIV